MKLFGCTFAILMLFAGVPRDAYASPELRRAAILTTVAEAAVSAAALIQDHMAGSDDQSFEWSVTYSERDWTLGFQGSDVDFLATGYLWGQENENLLIAYSGVGEVQGEPLSVHGRAYWPYDEEASDYRRIDFRQVMKFGRNTNWGWVIGAEVLLGGTIGAGAAVATAAAATGGVALGAGLWIGAGGFAAGATALVSASDAVKSMTESDEPVPPSEAPAPPDPPAANSELTPSEGTIFTAVSPDGQIMATGPNGTHALFGKFDWDGYSLGTARGGIVSLR